jgi:hypothetical protein
MSRRRFDKLKAPSMPAVSLSNPSRGLSAGRFPNELRPGGKRRPYTPKCD